MLQPLLAIGDVKALVRQRHGGGRRFYVFDRRGAGLRRPAPAHGKHRGTDVYAGHPASGANPGSGEASDRAWTGGHVEHRIACPRWCNLQQDLGPGLEDARQHYLAVQLRGLLAGEMRT